LQHRCHRLVGSFGVSKGLKVLDLGCGDGTTAVPEAQRGADVLGVDIAGNLVAAGNARAQELGLDNLTFQEGDATDLSEQDDESFDLVVSIFGAMFAPTPFDVAKAMVRVTRPAGRIVMGNWIPGDPTLVAQILKISASYAPPPPEGFVSPMTWGIEGNVIERFGAAGVPFGRTAAVSRKKGQALSPRWDMRKRGRLRLSGADFLDGPNAAARYCLACRPECACVAGRTVQPRQGAGW
jgi:SAM-dependent methyltransferase